MDVHHYRIRKSFLIPFGIGVFLLVVMLVLSFFNRRSDAETVVLSVLLLAALPVLWELFYRRIDVGSDNLTVRKFFRTRAIPWEQINQVGIVIVRRKHYLLLTTRRGFHILSNAYEGFLDLVRDVADRVPRDRLEAEVLKHLEDPPASRGDVLPIWLAVILMATLIVLKGLRII